MSLISTVDYPYFINALPLILAVSLVYAGTRFEDVKTIVAMGGRVFVWMLGFLAVSYAILAFFFSSL